MMPRPCLLSRVQRFAALSLALGVFAGAALAQGAAPMTIALSGALKPEPELAAMVKDLQAAAARPNAASLSALLAPSVRRFTRDLDPFSRWNALAPVTKDHLRELARFVTEDTGGGIERGIIKFDPAANWAEFLKSTLAGGTFGTMAQTPGAVCGGARYALDKARLTELARKHGTEPGSLMVATRPAHLIGAPRINAPILASLPVRALVIRSPGTATSGFEPAALLDGRKGFIESNATRSLNQTHVCFGKQPGGRWLITAVFNYGL